MKWQVPKIWTGDCYIICGGSSLASQFNVPETLVPEIQEEFLEFGKYLSQIKDSRVIGVNLAAFLGPWVDVAYFGDSDTYLDYKKWYDEFQGLKISSAGQFASDRYKSVLWLERNRVNGLARSSEEVSWKGKNSGHSAISLAVHLGATRIFLLGLDMYTNPEGRIHWHTGYPDKLGTLTITQRRNGVKQRRRPINAPKSKEVFARQSIGWDEAAKEAKALGIEIYNVNPESSIHSFPKIDLKDISGLGKRKKKKEIIEIRCVLKSGGDYSPEYVHRLKEACKKNTTLPFLFSCLTDMEIDDPEINIIKLKHDWPGWWSKIELFRGDLNRIPSIFFDLDTLITGNIDELLKLSLRHPFLSLRGFNQRFAPPGGINFASGIMCGSFGEYNKVYEEFIKDPNHHINTNHKDWRHGDQGFIASVIGTDEVGRLQEHLPDNYIVGKKALNQNRDNLETSRVIAWSGNPRFHQFPVSDPDTLTYELNRIWRQNG